MVAQECQIVPEWDNANPRYRIFAPILNDKDYKSKHHSKSATYKENAFF